MVADQNTIQDLENSPSSLISILCGAPLWILTWDLFQLPPNSFGNPPFPHLSSLSPYHLLPIGVDTNPAEAGDGQQEKDVYEEGGVNVCGVEDDEGHYVDNVDDEEGWDPDQGGVDEVIVEGADADDEEGVGGDGDGGEDDAEYTEPNENFMADNSILKLECVICKRNVTKHTFRDTLFDNGGNFGGRQGDIEMFFVQIQELVIIE